MTVEEGEIGTEPRTRREKLPSLSRESWISLGSVVSFLVLWEAAVQFGILSPSFFPSPSMISATFIELTQDGTLVDHTTDTIWRLLAAFLLAAVPGIALGLAMGVNSTVRAIVDPLVSILYPIPKIALLPLTMLIFGIGDTSIIVTAAITAFFVILLNTTAGVLEIDDVLLEVADNFDATGIRKFYKVILPGSLPLIFTGLRLGMGLALIVVVAAEFIASESGLGYLIFSSWRVLQVEAMYCSFIIIGVLGWVAGSGLSNLGNDLMPWRESDYQR